MLTLFWFWLDVYWRSILCRHGEYFSTTKAPRHQGGKLPPSPPGLFQELSNRKERKERKEREGREGREGREDENAELRPGVEFVVDGFEVALVHVGVDLGGGDIGVAEHFLDDAQVSAVA